MTEKQKIELVENDKINGDFFYASLWVYDLDGRICSPGLWNTTSGLWHSTTPGELFQYIFPWKEQNFLLSFQLSRIFIIHNLWDMKRKRWIEFEELKVGFSNIRRAFVIFESLTFEDVGEAKTV